MKRFLLLGLCVLLVGAAIPVAGHTDSTGNFDKPADHQECSWGVRDWTRVSGDRVGTWGANVGALEVYLYVHLPPHGSGSADPEDRVGVVWLEDNGFEGLQKLDFVCMEKPGDDWTTHSDQVIL